MFSWLKNPYPFLLQERKIRLQLALFVFIFIFLFLIIFQPFNLKTVIEIPITAAATIYALTSAVVAFLSVSTLVKVYPDFANEKEWNIGREILMMLGCLVFISLANFFLGLVIELHAAVNYTLMNQLADDFLHTFAIGFFPIMIITFINYTVLLKRNLSHVEKHNLSLRERRPELIIEVPTHLEITSVTNNNDITLKLEDLYYIVADGNYVEFHFTKNGELIREIKRNTLNNIEAQLKNYPILFRSHRTYIVNLEKIDKSSGNAQGYQLHLKGLKQMIPVSRAKLKDFDQIMQANFDTSRTII